MVTTNPQYCDICKRQTVHGLGLGGIFSCMACDWETYGCMADTCEAAD